MAKEFLFGHNSEETALEVKDYPYGFKRTSIFYWIETAPKKGDRFCSYTIDPKNGRKNKPKCSTYTNIGVMYRNTDNGHIEWTGLNIYDAAKADAFIQEIGGVDKLNPEQLKQYKQLKGEKIVDRDKITGDPLKDYKIKWEKDGDRYSELSITFDRPDGVTPKEIFNALKSVDQTKLQQVFDGWESQTFGKTEGIVRIKIRGGFQLTTVSQNWYKEMLARDTNNTGA